MLGGWQTCLYSFPFPRQANSSSSPALPIWVTGVHLQCCLPPQEGWHYQTSVSAESSQGTMRLLLNSAGGGNTHISSNMTTRVKKNQPQFTLPSAQEWKINCFNFIEMNVLCLAYAFQRVSWIHIFYWMHGCFPLKMLPEPSVSAGSSFRIPGGGMLWFSFPLGIWAIYLSFLINGKRNSLIILCSEKTAITICVYFLQFHFRCIKSPCCHLLPSASSLFFLTV